MALLTCLAQLFVLPRLAAPPAPGVRQLTHLLRHADARLGLLTIAFVIAGHFAAYTYVTPFLKENGSIAPGVLSSLLLAYGVAGIFGNFAGGAGVAWNQRLTTTAIIGLMAVSVLLLPLARGHEGLVALILVAWGLAFGGMPIALQLWVFKAAPEAMEGGRRAAGATFQIFIAFGSMLGGRVVDCLRHHRRDGGRRRGHAHRRGAGADVAPPARAQDRAQRRPRPRRRSRARASSHRSRFWMD